MHVYTLWVFLLADVRIYHRLSINDVVSSSVQICFVIFELLLCALTSTPSMSSVASAGTPRTA